MIEAVLFDLGNVVMEIDFRRTFKHWADASGHKEAHFHAHWSEDEAYRAHEVGALSFSEYAENLSERLGVTLPEAVWREGWNDLFVGAYEGVQTRLEGLQGQIGLYAFTNTNATHEAAWRARFEQEMRHFETIYVSSTIGMRKPDVAAFQWVAADMQLAPERILFLDDNPANIAGAERAGMQTALIGSEADVLAALATF
ncbi:MAG: HAD family phosphatase [Pseudomonadota bacterium]